MGSQSDRSSDMMLAGAIANSILRLLICIAAVFVVTALLNTVSLRDRPLSAVLIFLFLVLIVSTAWGFHYALFVSLLAALGFSWLLPPVGRFWLSDSRDIFALAAFLVIGITTSHLSDRARREALSAKRAEGVARRSEEGLREVIETMPAMAWSGLPDGSDTFLNRQWAEYTSLSAEQTASSGWQSTVHPEDVSGHMEKWRQSSATGQPFEHEVRLRRTADGQYRWFLVRGVPLLDEHGEVLKWYGIATDIEDRKRAEEALRQSEERWRSVFENSAIGVALTDLNGRFLATNHVFQTMVGYTEAELRALNFLDVTHEYHREANWALITELLEGKRRQFQIEKKYRRKDGSLIWVSNNVSLVPGTERVPRFLMALSEDITERKRAEALLTGEKRILEMVAKGDSLRQMLDSVCRFVEEQASGFLASILLVDGNRLRHGGAPSLPKAYTNAIDGLVIGPSVGSCGTAAYRGEQVIVEDIATDPLWADYREAALPHSLRACWSTPVFSSQGKVIATFAMYYREPRSPTPRDQETIEQITHLAGVAIERKLTQEALRRSEAYLAEAQRLTHTGSWAWSVRTGAHYWSQEIFRIYDCDPEVTPTWDFLLGRAHPEDRSEIERRVKMESTQKEWTDSESDFRIVLPDGTIKHLHTIAHPAMDESGEITEVVGTIMDVTERKQAEENLRRSEESLLEAQRLSHMGSWKHDVSSGAFIVSPEIYRIFGVQPDEDTSSVGFWRSRTHPEDQQRTQELFERSESQKTDYESDHRIVLPDGTIKHLRSVAHPVLSQSGELVEMIGTTIDVTERKRAEEERERLRQLEADLAHMNRVTMLGELASSLAHELNQPIAAAITSANACLRWLARNPPDLERARAAATRIENDGSRAAEIIQRLRAFYKTGAPPKRELVDLNQVAGEMLALLRNEADRHAISLRTELALQLPQIMADRVQLQQVLMNLLLNGIEAMTDGAGELVIRSHSTEDGFLRISVSDTGVGLPSEKLDRIFSAFYTTKPQGTGMGLAISRSIIEAHGGRMWATANAERGATFHFTLPAGVQQ
jgi:PAS domain S-box-containing protein